MIETIQPDFIEHSLTCAPNQAGLQREARWDGAPALRRLPVEFRAYLTDARIARVGDDSEVAAGDVAARISKLRVVEDVEEFEPEIESESLIDRRMLQHAEIGVVESRAVEEASVRGAKSPQIGVNSECAGQKVASRAGLGRIDRIRTTRIRFARIHYHYWAHAIRHIRRGTARQRCISEALVHLDGKAGREPRDPLHLPPLGQSLRPFAEQPVEREGPNVAGHEIVPDVAR